MSTTTIKTHTQNELLLQNMLIFYQNPNYFKKFTSIINGDSKISLRILDWFVTNYAKENDTVYMINENNGEPIRFKVYKDYKLKLKAYSKRRFDPFCRGKRIPIPIGNDNFMETTIGQLNCFKWAIENKVIEYIEQNYTVIENDMNIRNSTSRRRNENITDTTNEINNTKTRKKREELSISACKCIKKEEVKIVVEFN